MPKKKSTEEASEEQEPFLELQSLEEPKRIQTPQISDSVLDESLVRLYNSFKAGEQYTPLELATQIDQSISETRIQESLNRLKGKRLPLDLGHIKS